VKIGRVFFALVLLTAAGPAYAQTDTRPSVAISRQLAEARHLAIGSTIRLSTDRSGGHAREFTVVGIYEPTPNPSRLGAPDLEVRFHLPDLLDLTRGPGTLAGSESIDGINVALADPAEGRAFARDISARLPGIDARPASEATGNAGPFIVLRRFHLAIAAVTIGAATVFLLALTIMLVDERRETVGVLRLIGLPARRILLQVLLEGVMVAAAGAVSCCRSPPNG
jgi:ABC-type lipoprotein release transport system permease subunit